MAPDNNISCCVELLFKLHFLLSDSHTAFPKLPAFLQIRIKPLDQYLSERSERNVFYYRLCIVHLSLITTIICNHCNSIQSHPLSLLQTDFLQGPHQASGAIGWTELGGRLELSKLQVEGIWMVLAVLTSKWDKRLQFPCGNHRGCLFIHDFRHEFQISALFLEGIGNKKAQEEEKKLHGEFFFCAHILREVFMPLNKLCLTT